MWQQLFDQASVSQTYAGPGGSHLKALIPIPDKT